MTCKWCGSKQAFNDETSECRTCYSLRNVIEENPETTLKIIKEIMSVEKLTFSGNLSG